MLMEESETRVKRSLWLKDGEKLTIERFFKKKALLRVLKTFTLMTTNETLISH